MGVSILVSLSLEPRVDGRRWQWALQIGAISWACVAQDCHFASGWRLMRVSANRPDLTQPEAADTGIGMMFRH